MEGTTVAQELASYAHSLRLRDVDDEAIAVAKSRILDSVACAVGAAGTDDAAIDRVLEFAARKDPNGSGPILTTRTAAPTEYAAFANAALIRYLDWNDTYVGWNERYGAPAFGHPSGCIGAFLACANEYDVSGEDLLLATVLAYELYLRMADAAPLHVDGLDHVNHGLLASTLATGVLGELTENELAEAVNIAVSSHVSLWQTRCGDLTEWKGLAIGDAARNAVVAVVLARAGIKGPSPVFEGDAGFANLLSHPIEVDPREFGGSDGAFKIHETNLKRYPVCGGIQESLNCVFGLLDEHEIDWREIDEISIGTPAHVHDVCVDGEEKWDPRNRNTADHSLPYCVARAFVDGEMGPGQFEDEKLTGSTVRDIMSRMEVTERTDETSVRVTTSGGTFERVDDHRRDPLSDERRLEKVRLAARGGLPDADVSAIVTFVDTLEEQPSLTELLELTVLE